MSNNVLLIIVFSLILIVWVSITIFALRVANRSKNLSGKILPLSIVFLALSGILIAISFYYLLENQQQIPTQGSTKTAPSTYY